MEHDVKDHTDGRRRDPQLLEAGAFLFEDDGLVPNNPTLPLLIYPGVVTLDGLSDPARLFETFFQANGWGDGWRNGIYDFTHYHSKTHEVLGIARGRALVRFGARTGKDIEVKAGDVAIIPAGMGHKRLSPPGDLLVVGAYPASGEFDQMQESAVEHAQALRAIAKVPLPDKDPVYGMGGPLFAHWRR
jgi:uncharacterized protein YjlB